MVFHTGMKRILELIFNWNNQLFVWIPLQFKNALNAAFTFIILVVKFSLPKMHYRGLHLNRDKLRKVEIVKNIY